MKLNFSKKLRKLQANEAGFTLIELLVVIAIIGILSGIVLTSLGTARSKAKDSSAKASLSSMRSEAELNTDSAGTYPATICSTDNGADGTVGDPLTTLATAVQNNTGNAPVCRDEAAVNGRTASWAVHAVLNDTTAFCVDSSGTTGSTTATGGGAAAATCL